MFFAKPEITSINAWLNSTPLALKQLKGKAVLVDFWTYTCVNCIRTLPHIKEWHKKYSKLNLVVIGVHTPEFEFEKDLKNVSAAVKKFGIKYPVALDSNHATWNAFGNSYWPAKYLFDASGKLVYTHFGEGNYLETELKIRDLLIQNGKNLSKIKISGEEKVKFRFGITKETYCGSARNPGLGSSGACLPDGTCTYLDSGRHERDVIYLSGEWEQKKEFLETKSSRPAYILIKYFGSEINLVIHPPTEPATAKVFVDGKLKGKIKVDVPKMYGLHKTKSAEEHELKLEFLAKGAKCYAYTFG